MRLAYIDENKFSPSEPFFFIGGAIYDEDQLPIYETDLAQIQRNCFGTQVLDRDYEMHGKDLFHGKAHCKGKPFAERIRVFQEVTDFLIRNRIQVRLIRIDVNAHRRKYRYPDPEYHLGLMLILERICDHFDEVKDRGLVFADYEKDEITRSILDFSQFKFVGKTPMHFGRPLGCIVDTIYFTHSHHSRFLQVADLIVYMANRFEGTAKVLTGHANALLEAEWEKIKASGIMQMQRWP